MSTYPRSPSSGLRFAEIPGDSESPELYAPGYYHPVYLGEIYQGRYRVFRKLGFGDHSTVWLARDVQYVHYMTMPQLCVLNEFLDSVAMLLSRLQPQTNPGRPKSLDF